MKKPQLSQNPNSYSLMSKNKSVPVKLQNDEFDKKSDQLINNFSMNSKYFVLKIEKQEILSAEALTSSLCQTTILLTIISVQLKGQILNQKRRDLQLHLRRKISLKRRIFQDTPRLKDFHHQPLNVKLF